MRAYIGAEASDDVWTIECLNAAVELIAKHLGLTSTQVTPDPVGEVTPPPYFTINTGQVPATVLDSAIKDVGSRLFARRAAPNGVAMYVGEGGTPRPASRDPLQGVYPMLAEYRTAGFA